MALLEPHTSSPDLRIFARILTGLFAGTVKHDDGLINILDVELDMLAISPQAKLGLIPALIGINSSVPMCQPQIQPASAPSYSDGGVGVDAETHPMGSMVPYETRERRFTSSSGSGKTTWYSAKSNTNISSPPTIPHAETGHLYVHLDCSTRTHQYWMFGADNEWQSVSKGSEYPLNHDRVLSIRGNGEPSWVTRASISTTQGRKGRNIRGRSH
jgi:hypothetical protein